MGADLFDARPDMLGERADDVLGWSLRDMCLNGPEEALTRTEHAQPALYALSCALWDVLTAATGLAPEAAAGHSLGEYTALTAAGALTYDDGLALVTARGRAMAEAAAVEPSGMAALIGCEPDKAEEVALIRRQGGGRLQVANINAPGQVVVAGSIDDLDWLTENGPTLGVRRVIPLKVAGAFHSTFMEPAAEALGETLRGVAFTDPVFPVWSNTTARPHVSESIAATLGRQVVSPVRFSECLVDMSTNHGIDTFVHVGPGDVTGGMARKTLPDATVVVVSDTDGVVLAGDALGTM
jgi:[acyl-carrier-protein] S-malonyltransferase